MVDDILRVLFEALSDKEVDLLLGELSPLLFRLDVNGENELEYFEVVGHRLCFLLDLRVDDPLDFLLLQSLPEHAPQLLLLREHPAASVDPSGEYFPDFGEPESAEEDDGCVHPALDAFLLAVHELDLAADDDEVQVGALDVVHPLEDVVQQHWPTLLH